MSFAEGFWSLPSTLRSSRDQDWQRLSLKPSAHREHLGIMHSSQSGAAREGHMRIHEGKYAYDIEQPRDPQTQLPLNWRFTVYALRPVEQVMSRGEAESFVEAERQARRMISELEAKKTRPAA